MPRRSPSSEADRGQASDTGPSGAFTPLLRLLAIAMPRIASELGGDVELNVLVASDSDVAVTVLALSDDDDVSLDHNMAPVNATQPAADRDNCIIYR
ncbi:hypothetical protein [Corynebacterium sp.]|uniref:hypothetical protein n=1 Tax=Corynebacterium sp. TaxID=1720 RepID=UPI003B3B6266